jgi:hypothetical protein
MPKRKKLSDLYRRGKPLTVTDDDGDFVELYLRKPSDTQFDTILRRSNAARARYAKMGEDPESEEYESVYGTLLDFDHKLIVTLAMAEAYGKAKLRTESQVEHEDEWAEEGYLQSLVDRWNGDEQNRGLRDVWVLDPEDASAEGDEARHIYKELERFQHEVEERFVAVDQEVRENFEGRDFGVLMDLAVQELLKRNSNDAFAREFEHQQIFYTTRDPDDQSKFYFGTVDEVRDLPKQIFAQLAAECTLLMVDVTEGKDSPPTPDSSEPSEQPETQEVSASSGPPAA